MVKSSRQYVGCHYSQWELHLFTLVLTIMRMELNLELFCNGHFFPSHSEQWFLKLLDLDKKLLLLSLPTANSKLLMSILGVIQFIYCYKYEGTSPSIQMRSVEHKSGGRRALGPVGLNWRPKSIEFHCLLLSHSVLQNFRGYGARNVVCNVFSKTIFLTLKLNLNNDLSCLYENWNGIFCWLWSAALR